MSFLRDFIRVLRFVISVKPFVNLSMTRRSFRVPCLAVDLQTCWHWPLQHAMSSDETSISNYRQSQEQLPHQASQRQSDGTFNGLQSLHPHHETQVPHRPHHRKKILSSMEKIKMYSTIVQKVIPLHPTLEPMN